MRILPIESPAVIVSPPSKGASVIGAPRAVAPSRAPFPVWTAAHGSPVLRGRIMVLPVPTASRVLAVATVTAVAPTALFVVLDVGGFARILVGVVSFAALASLLLFAFLPVEK